MRLKKKGWRRYHSPDGSVKIAWFVASRRLSRWIKWVDGKKVGEFRTLADAKADTNHLWRANDGTV